jgi:16S rRNA (cytosine967-C5)-methyltransferase
MKLHKSLVEAVVSLLESIFNEGQKADRAVEKKLKSNKKWGSRDRSFIAENTYEMIRWYRLLQEASGQQIPDFWQLFGVWWIKKGFELPEWAEFAAIDQQSVKDFLQRTDLPNQILASIPDWLEIRGRAEIGADWDTEIHALNTAAQLMIRANRIKISPEKLKEILLEKGIETTFIEGYADALLVKKRSNLLTLEAYEKGLFEVQDAGSQTIAPFLEVTPDMTVIDACAGAGGKTLHLAALMHNKGKLVAMDITAKKLQILTQRASRNGLKILNTKLLANPENVQILQNTADRLLLDVPCSGLGVLKRNPDAKWKITESFVEEIIQIQADIIKRYATMVKLGGKMVYATCSILKSESEWQVEKFLTENTNWVLEAQHRTSPANDGFDGFYMARMKRIF